MAEQIIDIECTNCNASGVYRHPTYMPGESSVCDHCKGTGKIVARFTPFTGVRIRDDVRTVRVSARPMMGVAAGLTGEAISYEDFQKGKRPRV